jgi:Zn-dependent peptidase ImmA (M78 family)
MIVNWPKLSDEQIENKAADFRQQALAVLDAKAASSVPVEQIAEHYLGYELEFIEDNSSLPGDVIGGIDFDSNTIIINAAIESHIGRYSFTIAHEIAHHVLHRDIFLKARSGESIMCRGGEQRPIEEFQADRFAEALLMPADLIRQHYRKVKTRNIFKRTNQLTLAAKVIQSTGLDNVSVSAMVVRLNHLGLSAKKPIYKLLYRLFKP